MGLNKKILFFFGENVNKPAIYPGSISHAYLAILNDDLNSAYKIFSGIDSPRSLWGCSLTTILKGYMTIKPTYFGIRNFFEIDLDFLLKNNKIDYVEQCLGALDVFSEINQEVYKFAARVMLENHLNSSALKYLEKSKHIFYNDAELHFIYAKYYMDIGNYSSAYFYINECLMLLPEYYPAIVMKQKIDEIDF